MTTTMSVSTRDALIARGMPIVRRLAYKRVRRMPAYVELQDLIGAGHEGLLEAVERHDPKRDSTFEAFVAQRALGAMKDAARAGDTITRYRRGWANRVATATRQLCQELGRTPDDAEVATRLGISLQILQTLPQLTASIEADEADNPAPDARVFMREMLPALAKAMSALSARKRWVLEQYYCHEQTQLDIGRELGVTESRVSQMLSEAIASMRVSMHVSTDMDAGMPMVTPVTRASKKAHACKHNYNHSDAYRLKQGVQGAQAAE